MNHVSTNVSQYEIRHETSMARSGNHIPLDASSSTRALDAKSIGTRRMMLAGRASAKKMGTIREAGVLRRGRKCRSRSRTRIETRTRACMMKIQEPTLEAIVKSAPSQARPAPWQRPIWMSSTHDPRTPLPCCPVAYGSVFSVFSVRVCCAGSVPADYTWSMGA